jgi:hypothetical protein
MNKRVKERNEIVSNLSKKYLSLSGRRERVLYFKNLPAVSKDILFMIQKDERNHSNMYKY